MTTRWWCASIVTATTTRLGHKRHATALLHTGSRTLYVFVFKKHAVLSAMATLRRDVSSSEPTTDATS